MDELLAEEVEVSVLEDGPSSEVPSRSSTIRSKNPIYSYFDTMAIDGRNKTSKCKFCKTVLKQSTGSTSSLRSHLSSKHPTEYAAYTKALELFLKQIKTVKDKKETLQQPKISDFLNKPKEWSSSHPSAQLLTTCVATFLGKGLHAYSVVEEPAFKKLLHQAQPKYHLPSRTSFSENIIPKLYEKCRAESMDLIQKDRNKMASLSLTTDGWTSRSNDSYLAITCHYLNDNFMPQNKCLGHEKLIGSHTAVNLKMALEKKLKEYSLTPTTIPIYVVSDNAPNIVAALNLLANENPNFEKRPCFAHSLQLSVGDIKTTVKGLSNLCAKARVIVGHFKKSSSARDMLHKVQKQLNQCKLELVQDSITRWNSEYKMLERLYEIRAAVGLALTNLNCGIDTLSNHELDTAKSYIDLLRPLAEATTEICSETRPTSSLVYPVVFTIQKFLLHHAENQSQSNAGKTLAQQLNLSLQARFRNYSSDKVNVFSMLLDPCFKASLLETEDKAKWIEELKYELTLSEEIVLDEIRTDENTNNTCSTDASKTQKYSLWSFFDKVSAETSSTSSLSPMTEIDEEIKLYFKGNLIPRNQNPFDFWREKKSFYPRLSKLAKKYLSIPASQVASERQNSTAGNVISYRRQSLSSNHAEQLVFLHENL